MDCRILPLAVLMLAAAPVSARTLTYRIDPVHTQILFSVDHDGYSHPVGRMRVRAGWLRFDEDDWSDAKVVVDIDTASVDLGDKDWNDAVTGTRFLDAKEFPLAHFESASVTIGAKQRDAQHCVHLQYESPVCTKNAQPAERAGVLHGNLTLRGVTRALSIPFTVNRVGFTIFGTQTLAGFSAQTTLDRMQFGMMAFPKAVGTQVSVRLEVEASLDQDAQKQYDAPRGASDTHKDANDAAAQH